MSSRSEVDQSPSPTSPAESVTQLDVVPSKGAWYLAMTKPKHEEVAVANLERQGYPCYMPLMRVERLRRRKSTVVLEPMFPRYVFVHLDDSGEGLSWAPIRSTTGVSKLVTFGPQYAKVDDRLIDEIRRREDQAKASMRFEEGDVVTVTEGPFAGVNAIYQTLDADHRALILLDILSKPVPMRVSPVDIRRAD